MNQPVITLLCYTLEVRWKKCAARQSHLVVEVL
jgi:hypothetical protein